MIRKQADIAGGCGYKIPPSIFKLYTMEIKGKVHCFFEQSGTFKNEFIKRIGKRAGVRLHPHLLRKTLATQALRRGMPIEEVRLMLGHESIATTTIYAQTQQDSVKISHGKFV